MIEISEKELTDSLNQALIDNPVINSEKIVNEIKRMQKLRNKYMQQLKSQINENSVSDILKGTLSLIEYIEAKTNTLLSILGIEY